MKNARIAAQSRANLDARFKTMPPAIRFNRPVRGWIKAIREALGMTSAQLARRMGIKQPSLVAIEQSEARGAIRLATLRRAAAAMNCELVYAFVPRGSLESLVREQARKTVLRRMETVEHSMALENQSVPARDFQARLEALARDLSPRAVWDDR